MTTHVDTQSVIDGFIATTSRKRPLRPLSARAYRTDLGQFVSHIETRRASESERVVRGLADLPADEINQLVYSATSEDVATFFAALSGQHPNSLHKKGKVLLNFLKWVASINDRFVIPTFPKISKAPAYSSRSVVSLEQYEIITRTITASADPRERRLLLFCTLAWNFRLRLTDLLELNLCDVKLGPGESQPTYSIDVNAVPKRAQCICLDAAASAILAQHLQRRLDTSEKWPAPDPTDTSALFVNIDGERLTPRAISKVFDSVVNKIPGCALATFGGLWRDKSRVTTPS